MFLDPYQNTSLRMYIAENNEIFVADELSINLALIIKKRFEAIKPSYFFPELWFNNTIHHIHK